MDCHWIATGCKVLLCLAALKTLMLEGQGWLFAAQPGRCSGQVGRRGLVFQDAGHSKCRTVIAQQVALEVVRCAIELDRCLLMFPSWGVSFQFHLHSYRATSLTVSDWEGL